MCSLEEAIRWKSDLLILGCKFDPNTKFSSSIALKKIHLYSHSQEKYNKPIPEDIVLPNHVVCRIRYQSNSPFILEHVSSNYQVRNEITSEAIPVDFIPRPAFSDLNVDELPITSICSFLGKDLIGITPSNYCFYFQEGKQCRFCEILPTFKKEVQYPRTFKSLDIIERSILSALESESRLRFVAITTGNIHSYDATVDYFVEIGERLQRNPVFRKAEQVLATLMPPNDLSKIELLREKGFTKVYFPLEVFDLIHFKAVCPGKADYGYRNILKALEKAVKVFGPGNVYTNFVYGIQSLNADLEVSTYDPERENELCIAAVKSLLAMSVIPAFTLYHYAGYNQIGNLSIDSDSTYSFFIEWGELVRAAKIVSVENDAVIFSTSSLSNTLFNDGYKIAMQKDKIWT